MYFKILAPQKDKYPGLGLVNIRAAFWLEKGDEGWDEYQEKHHKIIPIFPKDGYQGKVDEEGNPADQKDYDTWVASLPTEEKDNPFCIHAIQFPPTVTEEEILWCFEFALAQSHLNYYRQGGFKVVNQDIGYEARCAFYDGVKQIPTSSQTAYEKAELAKCVSAESKIMALKEVDFTAVETVVTYRCK